jgi:hypothetical protein
VTISSVPALVARHLGPQERQIVTLRMHPSVLIPPLIVGIGGLSAAIAVAPVVRGDATLELAIWLFAGLLLAQLGRAVLRWLSEYIVITRLRVFVCSGAGITSSSPLKQLDDVRLTRSVAGRLLGFGTLVFDSAHLAIDNVPYPEHVYLEIYTLVHPMGDLLGENGEA